ncbi:MAG: hypothetical protein DRI95_13145 [Bacteroidetes bacterium]|nr:MAG: hypothetical protein DRI95_13145 [Bacteroidota bacterium]
MKYLPFFIILFFASSCKNVSEKFPFSEEEMVQNKMLKIFKNEKIVIRPYIEITSGFTDIYQSRLDYYPLPFENEEILKEIN